jgi:hypothetical protein
MSVPIGLAYITAETDRARIGSFDGELVNGQLLLQITTVSPSNMAGLAFAVTSLVEEDSGVRVLGDARYYPKPEPTVVALGYGNRETVAGDVVFEPRAFNLRWLQREGSSRFWVVAVEAETPVGVSQPAYTPAGFADGAIGLSADAVQGDDGETYGQVSWYE